MGADPATPEGHFSPYEDPETGHRGWVPPPGAAGAPPAQPPAWQPIEEAPDPYTQPARLGQPTTPAIAAQAGVAPQSIQWQVCWRSPEGRLDIIGQLPITATIPELIGKFRKSGHFQLTPLDALGNPTRRQPVPVDISPEHEAFKALAAGQAGAALGVAPAGLQLSPEILGWLKEREAALQARVDTAMSSLDKERQALAKERQELATSQATLTSMAGERSVETLQKLIDADAQRQLKATDREAKRMDDGQNQVVAIMQTQLSMIEKRAEAAEKAAEARIKEIEAKAKAETDQRRLDFDEKEKIRQADAKERELARKADADAREAARKDELDRRQQEMEREQTRGSQWLTAYAGLAQAQATAASPAGGLGQLKELKDVLGDLGLGGQGEQSVAAVVGDVLKEVLKTGQELIKAKAAMEAGENEGPEGPEETDPRFTNQQLAFTQPGQAQPGQVAGPAWPTFPALPTPVVQTPVAQPATSPQAPGGWGHPVPQAQVAPASVPVPVPVQAQPVPVQAQPPAAPVSVRKLIRRTVEQMIVTPKAQWVSLAMATIMSAPQQIFAHVQAVGSVRAMLAEAGAQEGTIRVVLDGLAASPLMQPYLNQIRLE